jgi:hypothetical protein
VTRASLRADVDTGMTAEELDLVYPEMMPTAGVGATDAVQLLNP